MVTSSTNQSSFQVTGGGTKRPGTMISMAPKVPPETRMRSLSWWMSSSSMRTASSTISSTSDASTSTRPAMSVWMR